MNSENCPDLATCRVVEESDGCARIIDRNHVSIAFVRTSEDCDGRNYSRVVFMPDVAHRIVKALDLAAAVNAFAGLDDNP